MLPSDALAAVSANQGTGLLIGRATSDDFAQPANLDLLARVEMPKDAVISVWLVRGSQPGPLPRKVGTEGVPTHTRLLDLFYLPLSPDPLVTAGMFDLISDIYDDLATPCVNLAMTERLIKLTAEDRPAPSTILDFGCGTGVAGMALRRIGSSALLTGTDASDQMLRIASMRGVQVLKASDWRTSGLRFDSAIASFVLHHGVSEGDLHVIARQIKPGGRLALNYFKAESRQLDSLKLTLRSAGLRTAYQSGGSTAASRNNPILVFERPNP